MDCCRSHPREFKNRPRYGSMFRFRRSVDLMRAKSSKLNNLIRAQLRFMRSQQVQPAIDSEPGARVREIDTIEQNIALPHALNHRDDSYLHWDAVDVTNWIVMIDRVRFGPFHDVLMGNMMEQGVDGQTLKCITMDDLHRLGITDYRDKLLIFDAIKELTESERELQKEESFAAEGVDEQVTLC